MASELDIAARFASVTPSDWRARVDADRGDEPSDALSSTTREGLEVPALFTADAVSDVVVDRYPGLPPYTRGARALGRDEGWDIRQEYDHPDVEVVREQLADDLSHGVESVWLHVGIERGVRVLSPGDVAAVLEPVDLGRHAVSLEPEADALPVAASVVAVARARGVDPAELVGSWGADPVGTLARTGTLPAGLGGGFQALRELASFSRERTPLVRSVHVSTSPYHDAGATAVQELAWGVATGVEYLRRLVEAGLSVDEAAGQMLFVFSVGGDLFTEVAKLRAGRLLWSKALTAAGAEPRPMCIHARTSWHRSTRFDPWVNALRDTTQAFAAAAGGADSIACAPFDAVAGPADAAGRRLARNTQLVLREEAHLHRVADPAGGSWYVEWLTDRLARAAWQELQSVERKGGMARALLRGHVSRRLGEEARRQRAAVATGHTKIIGVSDFARLEEEPLVREAPSLRDVEGRLGRDLGEVDPQARYEALLEFARLVGAVDAAPGALAKAAADAIGAGVDLFSVTTLLQTGRASLHVEPAPRWRVAQGWEELREAADSWSAIKGRHPRVLVAGLGAPADHRAAIAYARNVFSAGGIAPVSVGSHADTASVLDAWDAAGADIALLCGSQDQYRELVPELAPALRERGASLVLVTGDHDRDLEDAGIDGWVHPGGDALRTLRAIHRELGVSS